MRREDLFVRDGYIVTDVGGYSTGAPEQHRSAWYRPVQDAELAELVESMGYVKLDDIDVEALRDAAAQLGRYSIDTSADSTQVYVPPPRLRRGGWSTIETTIWAVLAALEGETDAP